VDTGLLIQTVVSGALVSALILGFLYRFGPRRACWPQVAAGVVFLDQATKWLVVELFADGAPQAYFGGRIQIGYHTNFLQGFGETSTWLLCATLVGAIGCVRLYQMLVERRYAMSCGAEVGLALLLGGVATVAAERAWAGFVIDCLQFGPHCNYVFNVADLAALAGCAILFVRGLIVLPGVIEQEHAAAGARSGGGK